MKAGQVKPLKRLADSGHLIDAKEKCKEMHREVNERNARNFVQRVFKDGYKAFLWDEVLEDDDAARQRLEEQRVIANVIGLAMIISVLLPEGDGK